MQTEAPLPVFDSSLSDEIAGGVGVPKDVAENLFHFFKSNLLFKWKLTHNDCEDRANAIAILLDEWNVPNYKAWIFGGSFIKRNSGLLINQWNYHVAVAIPVQEGEMSFYIIDPSSSGSLQTLDEWAGKVAGSGTNYFMVKWGHYYIFPAGKIEKDNWFKRCRQNYKWTMQGLSGINGVSRVGKAQLCFNKAKIKRTEQAFKQLLRNKPVFQL